MAIYVFLRYGAIILNYVLFLFFRERMFWKTSFEIREHLLCYCSLSALFLCYNHSLPTSVYMYLPTLFYVWENIKWLLSLWAERKGVAYSYWLEHIRVPLTALCSRAAVGKKSATEFQFWWLPRIARYLLPKITLKNNNISLLVVLVLPFLVVSSK